MDEWWSVLHAILASSLTSRSLEPISTDNMSEDQNIRFFDSLRVGHGDKLVNRRSVIIEMRLLMKNIN